jgi:hypothetical protein
VSYSAKTFNQMSCRFSGPSFPRPQLPFPIVNRLPSPASPQQLPLRIHSLADSHSALLHGEGKKETRGDTDELIADLLRRSFRLITRTAQDFPPAMSSQQIPTAWSERGYVPPEKLNIKDDEDEKGEAAYMKCFHESSKIGRVPNASYFINSPTARAYVEKRDKELFPVKEVSSKAIPNPDLPWWSNKKDESKSHQSSISSTVSQPNTAHSAQIPNTMPIPSSQNGQPPAQPFLPSAPVPMDQPNTPWSMEPRTGARGPPRMIR